MPERRLRQRNLLAAALAAIAATVVTTALLPAGLPQAKPSGDTNCWPVAGAAGFTPVPVPSTTRTGAPTFSPPPTNPPTNPPTSSPWPSPTSSPFPTASPCPTPTGWPTPTLSPSVPPTSPPPPGCPPLGDPPDYYERQLPLLHAANHIDATARGPVGPGYAGISIDVPECRIDVYWKGMLPSAVVAVIALYDPPINIVEHTDAPYENAELEPAADRLVNDPGLALAAGIVLVRVGTPEEGTAVTAGVLATDPPPDLAAAEAFLSQELSVRVSLSVEESWALTGRQDDRAPWYAGGRIKIEAGEGEDDEKCSAGWAIKIGRAETHHMLTAAHCGAKGAKVHNGDKSRQLGTLKDNDAPLDSAIIDVTSGGGKMFTGRPNSNTSLPVDNTAVIKKGAWICDSGASTGQNCDIKVDEIGERIRTRTGFVTATTTTHKDATGIAVGGGDSGGPAYIPVEKDTKVQAIGIMVNGHTKVDCRRDDDTRNCYRRMAFIPIGALLTKWDAKLTTG